MVIFKELTAVPRANPPGGRLAQYLTGFACGSLASPSPPLSVSFRRLSFSQGKSLGHLLKTHTPASTPPPSAEGRSSQPARPHGSGPAPDGRRESRCLGRARLFPPSGPRPLGGGPPGKKGRVWKWMSGCCGPWGGSACSPRGVASAGGRCCCCGGCRAPGRAPWPGKAVVSEPLRLSSSWAPRPAGGGVGVRSREGRRGRAVEAGASGRCGPARLPPGSGEGETLAAEHR